MISYGTYYIRDDRNDQQGGNSKLFVSNISPNTWVHDIEHIFGKYGRVCNVNLKDYGFVEFHDPQDADYARHKLNGEELDGNCIGVEFVTGVCYDVGYKGTWLMIAKTGNIGATSVERRATSEQNARNIGKGEAVQGPHLLMGVAMRIQLIMLISAAMAVGNKGTWLIIAKIGKIGASVWREGSSPNKYRYWQRRGCSRSHFLTGVAKGGDTEEVTVGVTVGYHIQEGVTVMLLVKNHHQEAPSTATTPGAATHHQGSKLNPVVHSVLQSPGVMTTGTVVPITSDDEDICPSSGKCVANSAVGILKIRSSEDIRSQLC